MRDIKFRGLEMDSPVGVYWVYGSYIKEEGYTMKLGIPDLAGPVTRHYIIDDNNEKREVAGDTVGEFTSILDKYTVEIYEGDLIKVFGNISEVRYSTSCACFHTQNVENPYTIENLGQYSSPAFEVVGNIYENPNLKEI